MARNEATVVCGRARDHEMRDRVADVDLRIALKGELGIDDTKPDRAGEPAAGKVVAVNQAPAIALEIPLPERRGLAQDLLIASDLVRGGAKPRLVHVEVERVVGGERQDEAVLVIERPHGPVREALVGWTRGGVVQGPEPGRELRDQLGRERCARIDRRQVTRPGQIFEEQRVRRCVAAEERRHARRQVGHGGDPRIEALLRCRSLPGRGNVVVLLDPGTRLLEDDAPPRGPNSQREVHVAFPGALAADDLFPGVEPASCREKTFHSHGVVGGEPGKVGAGRHPLGAEAHDAERCHG